MSKRHNKGRRTKEKEADRVAALEELLEEAVEEDEYDEDFEDFDGFDEGGFGGYDGPQMTPMKGKKVWVILGSILVVVAVAVLYVYQAGDQKTILGNQPIPAGQLNAQGVPDAVGLGNNPAAGIGVNNLPMGGNVQQPPVGLGQNFTNTPAASTVANKNAVTCPQCGVSGLSVCMSCGTVMQPLGDGSGLFLCPSCGSVGIPICPRDGGHMVAAGGAQAKPAAGTGQAVGGQFQCPACGGTGLPNWSQNGTPLCPDCGTKMSVKTGTHQHLALGP